MDKKQMIERIRNGLDDMVDMSSMTDPEWAKLNAIRFVENYRIMRSLEFNLDDEA